MSGPKVVRVITREELVAAGESLLRRLDAALAEWRKVCTSCGLSTSDLKATEDRRNSLEQILRTDRFAEFNQAAIAEINFLDADAGLRRERAAQARAVERARLHSGKELAGMLLRQVVPSTPEWHELQRVAAGELDLKDMDAVLTRAQQSLFQLYTPQLDANQKALAARLAGGEKTEDFLAWRQKLVAFSPRLEALFGHISELELLGQAERASELHQDILSALNITENAVREMRFDSITISLKKAKEDAVAFEKLKRKAAFIGAELARHRVDMEELKMFQADTHVEVSELQAVVAAGELRLSELQVTQVADARRKAVLEGLQQLGYQVNEELSTATSEGGRLVVHNPASKGYGVEIAAGARMEKLQVRTVAFDANRDSFGDIPAEQRWCGDFGALKELFKKQGSEVIIEKAMEVGAVPIKLLSSSTKDELRRVSIAPRQNVKS